MARSGSRLALVAMTMAAAASILLGTASAATYTVGEPSGSWDLRTDYVAWASSRSFHPGDQLVFKYSPQAHDVVEVSKADYKSCSSARPVATHTSGDDAVALAAPGTRYFICGVAGHCAGGMKVQIDVVPSGATSGSLAPAAAPGAANSPPSTPDSAAARATGFGALAGIIIAAGLMAY